MTIVDGRQQAESVDGIRRDHYNRYAFAAERLLEWFPRGAKVLDAACGVGYGSYVLSMAGHSVLGVDIDPKAVEFAEQFYASNLTEYQVLDLDHQTIPGTYDAIVSFETIEHVDDEIMREFAERSDHIICSVPNEDVTPFSKERYPYHRRHYTCQQFEDLLFRYGYNSIEWFSQHDKHPGHIYPGNDGRVLIAVAKRCQRD